MTPSGPRVGLILLRAEWFDSVVSLPELTRAAGQDADEIITRLRPLFGELTHWVVNSPASLEKCCNDLTGQRFDLIILSFQVWAEDFTLPPLLRAIGDQPLAVWCYLPWREPPFPASFLQVLEGSGPVGTFEGLGTLRNLGARFFFTQGAPDHPLLQRDLEVSSRAGQVRQSLRRARIGLLPSHNPQMQTTYVNEFLLQRDIGPVVVPLSVGELARAAELIEPETVSRFIEDEILAYPQQGLDSSSLEPSARASLALARLGRENGLQALSFNDIAPEMHTRLGLRPCLYPAALWENDILLSLEGDLGAATAMLILGGLSGEPLHFVEFWLWDEGKNWMVGGHAGPQDPRAARPESMTLSVDYEYAQSDRYTGVHYQFVAKPGRVTLLQLRATPAGWSALLASGEAVDTQPWIEGYPHAVFQPDAPIRSMVERIAAAGSTQHWIMAYGDYRDEVRRLCELLSVPMVDVTA